MNTERILIVDDDANLRKILSDILRVRGYAPVAAATGQAALERVEDETPAVALLDLRLEDMSGLEVMGEIKKRSPGTECIVITGHASQASAVEAVNLGAYSYVQKPYDTGQLLVTIRRAIEKQEAKKRLEHLTAVLRAISGVNQLIVREKDRDRLLQGACACLIETRGYHSAWIALVGESGELVAAAEAGPGEAFPAMVERLERGELPHYVREALAQPGVLAIEYPSSTCADSPLLAKCEGRGTIAVRLEHGGKMYGLLTVSTLSDFVADEAERSLLQEVAEDIAFALHGIALEEERKRMEEALWEREERLRLVVQNMPVMLDAFDAGGGTSSSGTGSVNR